jgi:hypothetical protein
LSQTPRSTSTVDSSLGHHKSAVFHPHRATLAVGFHQATLRCHALRNHRGGHSHARATTVGWTTLFGRSERSEKTEEASTA